MKKLLVRVALLGAAAGAALAARSYLQSPGSSGEVQITFDDGSTEALDAAEVQEYTDIARQLLEAM